MKKIVISLLFFTIAGLFSACKPEAYDTFGDIVGSVIDVSTGESVKQATVTLTPTAKNTYTGTDGQFEFLELEAQQYTLTVQKDGYVTNRKLVNVIGGETINVSLVMEKK
ncbi:MAG: carboxypeptidase regulatory-like domain-containing protein [Bacteroidales bacterium]|nr:carboxypeptidase regulatory-like domain-containing protein [Bacteroidales bacterium]